MACLTRPSRRSSISAWTASGPTSSSSGSTGERSATGSTAKAPLSPAALLPLLHDLGEALDHAHAAGVLHRDVKPSNVLLREDHAVLVDFGLARPPAAEVSSLSLTGTDEFVGTLAYAAPEQLRGEPATVRSDVYALALVAFEALTGRLPFDGETALSKATARLTSPPLSLAEVRPGLPPTLGAALARGLARAPSGRPASAGEFVRLLEEASVPPGLLSRLMRPAAYLLAAVAAVAAAAGLALFVPSLVRGSPGMAPPARPTSTATPSSRPVSFRIRPGPDLATGRDGHVLTALGDGRVVVSGGVTRGPKGLAAQDTIEVYDPVRNVFTPGPNLRSPRRAHTATVLTGGRGVLIVGGNSDLEDASVLAETDLYDVQENRVVAGPSLAVARHAHTATLLPDGSVLVVGGGYGARTPLASTEIHDAGTRTFRPGPQLNEGRFFHGAEALQDGRVLVVGGWGGPPGDARGRILRSAELYDPSTRSFQPAGDMTALRFAPRVTALLDGRLLVTGGSGHKVNEAHQSAEIFDPATKTFRAVGPMGRERVFHQAIVLRSGRVLVSGGETPEFQLDPLAEVFDPRTETFTPVGKMRSSRWSDVGVRLGSGAAFFCGGRHDEERLRLSEIVEELDP